MTQASLRLQQLVYHSWQQVDAILNSRLFKRCSRQIEASKGWLLCLSLLLLLWIWNWQLVLSGGMGLAALVLVYLVQQGQWRLPQVNWQALWKPSNRGLTLALISGAIVCLSTYFTLMIWNESGGSWLATGVILEGFGILAIGALLLWQRIEQSLHVSENANCNLDRWFNDLSDPDALKRLIAVQRLTQEMLQSQAAVPTDRAGVAPLSTAALADCFRLMLDRETEPIVCRALLRSLQTLNPKQTPTLQAGTSLPFSTAAQSKIALKQ